MFTDSFGLITHTFGDQLLLRLLASILIIAPQIKIVALIGYAIGVVPTGVTIALVPCTPPANRTPAFRYADYAPRLSTQTGRVYPLSERDAS